MDKFTRQYKREARRLWALYTIVLGIVLILWAVLQAKVYEDGSYRLGLINGCIPSQTCSGTLIQFSEPIY